jgi:polysaccharide export outer membrane protein
MNKRSVHMKFLIIAALLLSPFASLAQDVQKDVRLSAGDTIEIRYFYTPELNKTQIVRPDGRIVLQLVGEVVAAGKTPGELTQELVKKYAKFLKQIDIAIFIESYGSRTVYVGGEVNRPGEVPILRNLTALEAIMLAGGVNSATASLSKVYVIRQQGGKYVRNVLDLEEVLLGNDDKPFHLLPLDLVYVPTRIGSP